MSDVDDDKPIDHLDETEVKGYATPPKPEDEDSEQQREPEPGASEGVGAPLAGEELPGGAQR